MKDSTDCENCHKPFLDCKCVDEPEKITLVSVFYGYFNRGAEEWARLLRLMGVIK
jgi:hypothetical protein